MKKIPSGIWCITSVVVLFGYLAAIMGLPNMLNTIMKTAHDLLLNTVFYLMSICVITGAIGRVFVEFGVVTLLERTLRPLMRPIFNLPGVTSLGAVMTFLSDNPAIISLANDKRFASYFKKYQFISLTNFGTAFGMGLLVMVFMASQGYYAAPCIGLIGACIGCVCSTRLMQRFVLKAYPQYAEENAVSDEDLAKEEAKEEGNQNEKTVFIRLLNAMLDGGRSGVDVGIAIIPGVLIISTFVMMFTFGAGAEGAYDGSAYQGVELLPWLANKIGFVFDWLFGFQDPHLVAVPHHRSRCRRSRIEPHPRFHTARLDRRQRHRCVHRHRYVLERIPQHPHRHARLSRLSRPYSESHPRPHLWRHSGSYSRPLDVHIVYAGS